MLTCILSVIDKREPDFKFSRATSFCCAVPCTRVRSMARYGTGVHSVARNMTSVLNVARYWVQITVKRFSGGGKYCNVNVVGFRVY